MRTQRSGARKQHKDEEVLSAQEVRGRTLKRYVRAAAALREMYDDASLARAIGKQSQTVGHWWDGSRPSGPVLFVLADVTGLSADELTRFVYSDGPPPTLPAAGSPVASSVQEGLRRDRERPPIEAPGTLEPSPRPQTRGSGAGRE